MCSATCSCRWAWTNSESFSRAHATCLSAALGSAHTVRISIRPVACSPSTLARLRTMQLMPRQATRPKPLLMLAGIRWRAYSQIDGSRGAAAGEGGGGAEVDCLQRAGRWHWVRRNVSRQIPHNIYHIWVRPARVLAPVQSPTLSSRYLQLFDKGFLAAIATINYKLTLPPSFPPS